MRRWDIRPIFLKQFSLLLSLSLFPARFDCRLVLCNNCHKLLPYFEQRLFLVLYPSIQTLHPLGVDLEDASVTSNNINIFPRVDRSDLDFEVRVRVRGRGQFDCACFCYGKSTSTASSWYV